MFSVLVLIEKYSTTSIELEYSTTTIEFGIQRSVMRDSKVCDA